MTEMTDSRFDTEIDLNIKEWKYIRHWTNWLEPPIYATNLIELK